MLPIDVELIRRRWQLVLGDVQRNGFAVIYAMLAGSVPLRYLPDVGKLEVGIVVGSHLFEKRGFEPILAQAIYALTGYHCGVIAVPLEEEK